MRTARLLSAVTLTLAISTLGCINDHTYKYFTFTTARQELAGGRLAAHLAARYVKISEEPKVTHKGPPYRLVISFTTPKKEDSPAEVKDISLKTGASKVVFQSAGGAVKTVSSAKGKVWFSSWSAKDVKVPHEDLTLTATIVFRRGGKVHTEQVSMPLKKVYKEHRRNDTFDGIMSV